MKKGKSQSKLHPDQLETSKQYKRIQNYNNDITEIKKEVDQIQKQIDEEISKDSALSLSNDFADEGYSPNLTPNQSSATKRKTRTENLSTKQGEKPHQREIYHQTGTEKVIPMSFDSYELIEQLKSDNKILSHKLKQYASKKSENEKTIKNLQKELNEAHQSINNLQQKNQVLLDNNQQPKFIDSKLIKKTLPKTEPDSLIQLDNDFYQKLDSNDSDRQQLIKSLIESKRKENDLTVQIEKLNTVNRDLQNRLDFANHQKDSEGKAESEKMSQINKKCADLTEENRQLKIQLINETTLKIENDELKKKLNEKTKSETKESQTIAELTEKWSNLAKENMALKTSLSQMNSIENQNKELVTQIENLQKQNTDLKAKLEEERNKSKTGSKSPKKAKSKSRSKSASKTKETTQNNTKIDQNESNSNNQNQLNEETQRLQNELNEAKETIVQMENGFEQEKKELEKKYNEIIDNFTKNIKKVSNSHESSYKKEITSLESQLEHQKQLYSQLVNVNEKLLDQLNKSHSNNLSLITQMDELQHSENICQSINYSKSPIKNNTSEMNSSRPFEEDDQQFNELKKATELLQKTLQEDIESRQNSPQKKSPKRKQSPKRSKSPKNKKDSKKSPQKSSANINETPNSNQKQSNKNDVSPHSNNSKKPNTSNSNQKPSNKNDVSPHSNNSKKPNTSNTENSIQQKDAKPIETNQQNQNSSNEMNKSDSNNTVETSHQNQNSSNEMNKNDSNNTVETSHQNQNSSNELNQNDSKPIEIKHQNQNSSNELNQNDSNNTIETKHQNQNSSKQLNKSDSNHTIETKTIFSIQLESPSNHVSIELESTNQKPQEDSNEKLPEKQNDDIDLEDFDIENENEQLGSSISFSDLEKIEQIDEGDEHKSENKRDRCKYSQLNYNSEEDFDDTDPLYCDFIYK